MKLGLELYYFVIKNAWACLFGALLLGIILLTEFVSIQGIARYDIIFICAILIQVLLLLTKLESLNELKVIIVFHILATLMELFKTSPDIGSWTYPSTSEALFVVATVPLFTGFLYSAVGSYISRAIRVLRITYVNFPKHVFVAILSAIIYINFISHHYILDLRYILFAAILVLFWNTYLTFQVYERVWRIHFITSGLLTAFFIWIAENIASYSNVWLYPDQIESWILVSPHKIGSWFLLLIVSFAIVSIVHRDRFTERS